jgi:serine/threonine protein kinase
VSGLAQPSSVLLFLYTAANRGHNCKRMSSEQDPSASSSAAGKAVDPMIGQVIDKRYRLTSKLGEGGMGEVYAADHLRIARSVAIKLLRAEVLTNEEAVKRFEQEAMTASSIGHENIIRIEDSGKLEDGRIYLAMELLAGMAFNDLIDSGPLAPERLLHILIQTCHGLAAAHQKGIVHRDMKPENIYITHAADGSDLPKLLDFGIAKVSQAEGENHLTRTGTIFGTPFYMAPEQALGQGVDHRVDVYAMGVIMYEVFCGEVPFGGESFMGILTQHITSEPAPPSVTAAKNGMVIPPGVEDIILRAMKKEPADRYQSMNELVEVLIPLYRSMAGAGMSTYMAAHNPPPSMGVRPVGHPSGYHPGTGSPTPMPIIRDEASQPYALPGVGHDTGRGHNTGHPSGGHPHTGHPSAGHNMGAPPISGGYAGHPASDSLMVPARKSKAGLIVMLLLVLAAAGGAAAFFLLDGGDDKEEETASNGTDTTDPLETDAPETDPPEIDPPEIDPQNGTVGTDVIDAGAEAVSPDANSEDTNPPEEERVTVLLDSRPARATVYQDGKKIGRTPLVLQVLPSDPTSVVLKFKRHDDEQVILDGTETKVTSRLSRKGRTNPNVRPPDKNPPDKDPPIKDPPIKDPPPRVDPCRKNPNLPECMLE